MSEVLTATPAEVPPLRLNRRPHAGTKEHPGGQWAIILAALANFFTVALFGRGSGKSPTALFLMLKEAALPRFKGRVYDFALATPFNDGARDAYRVWKRILRPFLSAHMGLTGGHDDAGLTLHLCAGFLGTAGVILDFWGLEAHDNLRRYRKHRIVVDEGKDCARDAIFATLMPMLFGRDGKILVMGTPGRKARGAQWLATVFRKGQDPESYPGFFSLNAPSQCNPFLKPRELQTYIDACEDERQYREEINAEILQGEGAVFSNIDGTFTVPVLKRFRLVHDPERKKVLWTPDKERPNLWVSEPPDAGDSDHMPTAYCAGLDLGVDDRSVFSGFNRLRRRQAFLLRVGGMDYTHQLPLIDAVLRTYNRAFTVYDATGGHGSVVTEALTLRYGDGVSGRTWSSQMKEGDIARGQMLCTDAGKDTGWSLMDVPWQRAEFEQYQLETETKAGKPKRATFGAPEGMHDDSVAAACLVSELVSLPYAPRQRRKPGPLWEKGEGAEVKIPTAWLKQQMRREKRRERLRAGE